MQHFKTAESRHEKHRELHNMNEHEDMLSGNSHVFKRSITASIASVRAFQRLTLFILSIVLNISEGRGIPLTSLSRQSFRNGHTSKQYMQKSSCLPSIAILSECCMLK